jgi:adenylate kinase family enzyme
MKKIVIFGSPGSGKTAFAEKLGLALDIQNVIHLDYFFWKPGWTRTTTEERYCILKQLMGNDIWIIEGNFSDIEDYLLSASDTVLFLSVPRLICIGRVVKRYFYYLLYGKIEIAPGCPDKITREFLKSIWKYPLIDGLKLRHKLEAKKNKVYILTGNNQNENINFLLQSRSERFLTADNMDENSSGY